MGRTQIDGDNILDNSVEGVDINESTLEDYLIPFSDSSFTSTNIHSAIIESKNSFANFEYVRGSDLIIENNKSLMIADTLILNGYDLIIEGNGILGVF